MTSINIPCFRQSKVVQQNSTVSINIRPGVLDLRKHGQRMVFITSKLKPKEWDHNLVLHYLAQLSEDRRYNFIQLGHL